MMMRGPLLFALPLLAATAAWAQLDLGAMNTQTVKAGQPWAAIDTKVESLALNVQVNRGVVTTVATLEYTPGAGLVQEYVCTPIRCMERDTTRCKPDICENRTVKELLLDSLETTVGFHQADNTVLTDMYLWVGNAKVKADLQERALASAQYEDIVKRRRDPALIETWGNGYYNLRIFPNESKVSRKIEIEFVQGMEDGGSLVKTILPVMHRLAKVAYTGVGDYSKLPDRTIKSVTLTAVALDGNTYDLKWEGLGSGKVGAAPLHLAAADVADLKEGILSTSAAACSGCLTPWTAERGGASYFGIRALLASKEAKFDSEPTERNFLLDVKGKDTTVAARARKVALLSLKAYASAPHSGNLGISDGQGGITYIFPSPVTMDADNLRKAYETLKAWTPRANADAHATLRAYARSRNAGAPPSVAYLVNNDTTPYFHWPMLPNGTPRDGVQAQYEAWEKAQSAKEDETIAALSAAKASLFGFWNDYRLNRVATATGGFQVGTLHGYIYFPMRGGVVADLSLPGKPVDPVHGIHLPPLFGPGRPDAWSIADLKVTASGLAIDHLVVLQAQQSRYWGGPIALDGGPVRMAKRSSDFVSPWYGGSPDSVELRIAGQHKGAGSVTFTISGLWGGLRFVKEVRADLPAAMGGAAGGAAAGAGIWAYQQGEAWARGMKVDIKAVQQLGKDYHIVNRQMSLLALEPGMVLWTEMPGKDGGQVGGGARELNTGAPMTDSRLAFSGQTAGALDRASLEDILNAAVGIRNPVAGHTYGAGALTARRSGAGVRIGWALPGSEAASAEFRILDLNGKEAARLSAARNTGGYAVEWTGARKPGAYIVVARAGSRTLIAKILVP